MMKISKFKDSRTYLEILPFYTRIYWPLRRTLQWISRTASTLRFKNRASTLEILGLLELIKKSCKQVPLIKVGGDQDGGYLVADDLDGIGGLFSPGVGDTAVFDEEFSKMGVPVYMADASVDRSPIEGPGVHFLKKFVGSETNDLNFISLSGWLATSGLDSDELVLQMDIEGSEWSLLKDIDLKTLMRFRVMVIEFHDCHKVFKHSEMNSIKETFEKILMGFSIVNIHPNNGDKPIRRGGISIPPLIEVTFHRSDRFGNLVSEYPNFSYSPLNHTNDSRYPAVGLLELCGFIENSKSQESKS